MPTITIIIITMANKSNKDKKNYIIIATTTIAITIKYHPINKSIITHLKNYLKLPHSLNHPILTRPKNIPHSTTIITIIMEEE
jgi:hypothetical protein